MTTEAPHEAQAILQRLAERHPELNEPCTALSIFGFDERPHAKRCACGGTARQPLTLYTPAETACAVGALMEILLAEDESDVDAWRHGGRVTVFPRSTASPWYDGPDLVTALLKAVEARGPQP